MMCMVFDISDGISAAFGVHRNRVIPICIQLKHATLTASWHENQDGKSNERRPRESRPARASTHRALTFP